MTAPGVPATTDLDRDRDRDLDLDRDRDRDRDLDIDQDVTGDRNRVAGRDYYHRLTQYVFFGADGAPVPPSATGSTLLDSATVHWHLTTFVRPAGFTSALDKLRGDDRVVFVADQDTGINLRALGIALLDAVFGAPDPAIDLIEADVDLDLGARPVADNALVLLDLTAMETGGRVDSQLGAFLGRIVEARGRLVVLLPGAANTTALADRYGHLVAEITAAPPATDVLRAHLTASGVDPATADAVLADAAVTDICLRARPADVVPVSYTHL